MKRKVIGLVEVPYDRFPDGRPKAYDAYELECGHKARVGIVTGYNRSLSRSPIELDRQFVNCKQCKET